MSLHNFPWSRGSPELQTTQRGLGSPALSLGPLSESPDSPILTSSIGFYLLLAASFGPRCWCSALPGELCLGELVESCS